MQKRNKGYDAICLIIGIILVLGIIPPVAGTMITCPSGYLCISETDAAARWGSGNYGKYSSDYCGKNEDGAPVLYCFAKKYVMSVTTVITACPQISCPAGQALYCPRNDNCPGSCGLQCKAVITPTTVPPPQCSPPSCKPGETVYCPGTCPNGCGLQCRQLELSCSPPSCGPGETVYCPGTCPNGCGLECKGATPVDQQNQVPSDATLNSCRIISQGDTVSIGDSCLNIFNAVGGESEISWYDPGMTPGSSPPRKIIDVLPTQFNFYVAPEVFTGYTGTWYRGYSDQVAFIVKSTAPSCRVVNQGDKVDIGDNCLNIINAVGGYGSIAWYGNPSQSPGKIPPEMVIDTRATESQFFINPDTFTERMGRWYRGYTDQLAFIVTPHINEFIQVNTVTPSEGLRWGQAITFTGSDTFREDKNCYLNITGPGLPDSGVIFAAPAINTDGSWTYEWNPSSVPGYPDPGPGTYIVRIMNGAKTDFVKWKLVFVEGPSWQPAQFAGQTPRSGLEMNMPFVLTPATWPGGGEPETSHWLLPTGDFFSTFGDLLVPERNYGTQVSPETTLDKTPPPGYAVCNGELTNLRANETNCGKCGYSCYMYVLPEEKAIFCEQGTCVVYKQCKENSQDVVVDLATDVNHCGSCEKTCEKGSVCASGQCHPNFCGNTFGEGNDLCVIRGDIKCTDIQSDPHNCGVCGNDCFGGTCVHGKCTCNKGLALCDNTVLKSTRSFCVDLLRDPNYCGDCSTPCRGSCIKGQCLKDCAKTSKGFTDLFNDRNNCGDCGQVCRMDQDCSNGRCVSPVTAKSECLGKSVYNEYCERSCVNASVDSRNCGACGHTCYKGLTCVNSRCVDLKTDTKNCGQPLNDCGPSGQCCHGECIPDIYPCITCPSPLKDCDNRCVRLDIDPNNCGRCGNVCTHGCGCENGVCNDAEFNPSDKKWTCL